MTYRRPITVTLVTFAACIAALTACGSSSSKSSATGGSTTVKLVDYGFQVPAKVEGRVVDLTFENDGKVVHELALNRAKPGTTAQEVTTRSGGDDSNPWLLDDVGGVPSLGPGRTLRYQRELAPGTYVLTCHLPAPGGSTHLDKGMVAVFEVTDAGRTALPSADATISIDDKAISLPALHAGSQTVQIVNRGTTGHELNIGGIPPKTVGGDLEALGEQIGSWFGDGQPGDAPGGFVAPGGQQTIQPGTSVWLTVDLQKGYTYRFDDNTSDSNPLEATTTVS